MYCIYEEKTTTLFSTQMRSLNHFIVMEPEPYCAAAPALIFTAVVLYKQTIKLIILNFCLYVIFCMFFLTRPPAPYRYDLNLRRINVAPAQCLRCHWQRLHTEVKFTYETVLLCQKVAAVWMNPTLDACVIEGKNPKLENLVTQFL
jgi:hypothetical protein